MPLITINKSITVNSSAAHAWNILGAEFTDVARWASSVVHSVPNTDLAIPSGAPIGGRVCDVPGYGETTESFTEFSNKDKSFTFEVTAASVPGFVKNATNGFTVTAIDDESCIVTADMSADATGVLGVLMAGMMKMKFGSTLDTILEDFKVYAETGKPSARKVKVAAKVAAKVTAAA